jgi:hypothetical protein
MSAVLVEVADAITEQLNAAGLTPEFEAERSWADWDEKLEDSDELHVDVVGIAADVEIEDRTTLKYTCTVHIGVRKRFKVPDQDQSTGRIDKAEVDALVLLVQQIGELFAAPSASGGRLTEFDVAVWEEFKPGMWFNRKLLRENRQFTGIVRVIHTVDREI